MPFNVAINLASLQEQSPINETLDDQVISVQVKICNK